jgi:hypothetical protein
MPAIGNAYIEKMRGNSAWFKYGTGAIDFASVMFLDPTSHGLGLLGKTAKLGTVTKMPKGGWSTADIDHILSQNKIQSLMTGIWRNKDNPQLLMNTELARRSGMGGARFASIASKLQDEEELGLFVRVGMGDGRALEELTARNALIRPRLDGAWRRGQPGPDALPVRELPPDPGHGRSPDGGHGSRHPGRHGNDDPVQGHH